MKKLTAILLTLMLAFSLFACGAGNGSGSGSGSGTGDEGGSGDTQGGGSGNGNGATEDGGDGGSTDSGSQGGEAEKELTDADVKAFIDEKTVFLNPVYTEENEPDGVLPKKTVYVVCVFEEYESVEVSIHRSNVDRIIQLGLDDVRYISDAHAMFTMDYPDYDTFLEKHSRVFAEKEPDMLGFYVYSHYTDYDGTESEDNYHPVIETTGNAINAEITDAVKAELTELLESEDETKVLFERTEQTDPVISVQLVMSRWVSSSNNPGFESAIEALSEFVAFDEHFIHYTQNPIVFDGADISDGYSDYIYVYMVFDNCAEDGDNLEVCGVELDGGKLSLSLEGRASGTDFRGVYDLVIKLDKSLVTTEITEIVVSTKQLSNGLVFFPYPKTKTEE